MRRVYVETELLAPYVKEYVDRWWNEHDPDGTDGSPFEVLAERAKCSRDMLFRIARQSRKSCSFELADKILCALYKQEEWYLNPGLLAVYDTLV